MFICSAGHVAGEPRAGIGNHRGSRGIQVLPSVRGAGALCEPLFRGELSGLGNRYVPAMVTPSEL